MDTNTVSRYERYKPSILAYRESHKDKISKDRAAYRAAHIAEETAAAKAYKKAKRKECNDMQRDWIRTIPGKISNTYSQMKIRVQGKGSRGDLYAGLPICTKEQFYGWAFTDPTFLSLHAAWAAAGYPLALSPSIDRIINERGYMLSNCQWLTHGDNTRKQHAERKERKAAA